MSKSKTNRNKPNKKRRENGISLPLTLAMIICLAILTSAGITAYEQLRDFCLSRTYVKEITIKGNQRISSADILGASKLNEGIDSVQSIMPHVVEKFVKTRSRYLERVSVQRRFAHERIASLYARVTIEVKEREPLAFVKSGKDDDSFMVIDAQGFVLEQVKSGSKPIGVSPDEGMPVIFGIDAKLLENVEKNETLDTIAHPTLDLAMDVLINARSIIPQLYSNILFVDAQDPDNIILQMQQGTWSLEHGAGSGSQKAESFVPHAMNSDSGITVRLASDRIEEGLNNILPVIVKRREENKITGYIDARFAGAVYCGKGNHYEGGWKSG